jgi:hypothetical protein
LPYATLSIQPARARLGDGEVVELIPDQPIFVGFKADTLLQRFLESLGDSNRQYISDDESGFLRFCRMGEDVYVGKIVKGTLTTDQVEDIRRNVTSIMQKLRPGVRCPGNLRILACRSMGSEAPARHLGLPQIL